MKMLGELKEGSRRDGNLDMSQTAFAWKVRHPNIVAMYGVWLQLKGDVEMEWAVMELLQGSLADMIYMPENHGIFSLTLREKVDMAHDSLSGLNYLHCLVRGSFKVILCVVQLQAV